ncbi:phage head morphogenesis protein [Bacillus wiedmannii]|uniref:phage head morphogenesis protein n=1 Tax=Bacillus wiedmannii TaxID=1890302 RepID=UPI0021CEC01A|nr:phage head morphogenesis protein [Bacillus wiedmannii]MCU5414969.1 phage head morphogenesis protein [Bacillus wiedmannii]
MNHEELRKLQEMAIEQQRKLIRFKDEHIRMLLEVYAEFLQDIEKELSYLYTKTSLGSPKDAWDWDEIRRGKDLEAILKQMEMSINRMNGEVTGVITNSIKTVGVVDYAFASYIAAAHIQGYIIVPPVIPERAIKVLLEKDWGHGHFSDNLWGQTENFKEHLRTTLVNSMQRGESFRTTTVKLQKRIGQEAYKSERLVRSEIITASNEAKKEYMTDFDKRSNEMGMELLKAMKVLETLDRRTCQKCQAMDGREFSVEEAKSIPATEHPNCRRTFVAVIRGFDNSNRKRAARSTSTGKTYRTDAKNFEEYAEEQKLLYSDKYKNKNMNI